MKIKKSEVRLPVSKYVVTKMYFFGSNINLHSSSFGFFYYDSKASPSSRRKRVVLSESPSILRDLSVLLL